MAPPAHLLEKLSTSRFIVSHAPVSVGMGERRSRAKGSGIEFVEHRAYQRGDDTRHLDARLLARFDQPYIRLYTVDQQLPVTIIVDASASMRYGTPDKFACAIRLAQFFGFIGLAGGDQVRIAMAHSGTLSSSERFSGASQADRLFDWVARQSAGGESRFGDSLSRSRSQMRRGGLVFLISDWWDEEIDQALDGLVEERHEIVAIQILAPEEINPAAVGTSDVIMTDSETGESVDVMLDGHTIKRYRAALTEWCDALQQKLSRRQARYFRVSSAVDPQTFFLKQMRIAGVIS